jgi:thiamine pyrophosphokinase
MKCFIAGALTFDNQIKPDNCDLVIAADAGYNTLLKTGIKPDLIVGDFDSIKSGVPSGTNVIRHPVMKDDTDMLLAVRLGLERGYREFHIYGGLGERLDHTLANIQVLNFIAENGGRGFLYGRDETITVIKNGEISFPARKNGFISVFAMGGDARGVNLKGLLYPLANAILTPSYPLGVSNEFTGTEAAVSAENGTLIVIWTN